MKSRTAARAAWVVLGVFLAVATAGFVLVALNRPGAEIS